MSSIIHMLNLSMVGVTGLTMWHPCDTHVTLPYDTLKAVIQKYFVLDNAITTYVLLYYLDKNMNYTNTIRFINSLICELLL